MWAEAQWEWAPHTLLRIAGPGALSVAPERRDRREVLPEWVCGSLQRAPWMVVRRAQVRDGLIPVGVRGESRQERFAAWISIRDVLECVTPHALASRHAGTHSPRHAGIPALAALDSVSTIMRAHGFHGVWGPTGSVGFELASGCPTATLESDLDLAVQLDSLPDLATARLLHRDLSQLPVRTDALLETPQGGASLAEYVRMPQCFVLRTAAGPRLVTEVREPSESCRSA
jgi:phosphoribosyl-dephospho-CoA transferase